MKMIENIKNCYRLHTSVFLSSYLCSYFSASFTNHKEVKVRCIFIRSHNQSGAKVVLWSANGIAEEKETFLSLMSCVVHVTGFHDPL